MPYVPCVPQRYVMCALAVGGTTVAWMLYVSSFNILHEVTSSPAEEIDAKASQILEEEIDAMANQIHRCYNAPIKMTIETALYKRSYWSRSLMIELRLAYWLPMIVSNVVCGVLTDMVGPKHVWGIGLLVAVLSTSLTPFLTWIWPSALFANSVVSGISSGVLFPSISVLVAYWVPVNERTILVAFIESTVFIPLIVNIILNQNIAVWGVLWDTWLYVSGLLGLVWLLAWCTLFHNSPSEDPHMPPDQLQDLEIKVIGVQPSNRPKRGCKPMVPWKEIFMSPPYLSLLLISAATSWVHSIIGYEMNNYLSRVLNITSILVRGQNMTILAVGAGLGSLLVHGWISDKLISSGLTSRTANRRLLILFPTYASAVLLVAISLLECNRNWIATIFFLLIPVQGVAFAPLSANVVDLAPRYAGLLRGVMIASTALSSVLCRLLVDAMIVDASDYSAWARVFQVSAAISILLPIPYFRFGSGEIQTWNYFAVEIPDNPHSTVASITPSHSNVKIEEKNIVATTNKK